MGPEREENEEKRDLWIHGAAGANVLLLSTTVQEAVRSRRDHRQLKKPLSVG